MYDNAGIIHSMIAIHFWLPPISTLWSEEDTRSLLKTYTRLFLCGTGLGWCGCGVVADESSRPLLVVMNPRWVSLVGRFTSEVTSFVFHHARPPVDCRGRAWQ